MHQHNSKGGATREALLYSGIQQVSPWRTDAGARSWRTCVTDRVDNARRSARRRSTRRRSTRRRSTLDDQRVDARRRASTTGHAKRKVAPSSGADSTHTRPPRLSTMRRTIATARDEVWGGTASGGAALQVHQRSMERSKRSLMLSTERTISSSTRPTTASTDRECCALRDEAGETNDCRDSPEVAIMVRPGARCVPPRNANRRRFRCTSRGRSARRASAHGRGANVWHRLRVARAAT